MRRPLFSSLCRRSRVRDTLTPTIWHKRVAMLADIRDDAYLEHPCLNWGVGRQWYRQKLQ